MVDALRKAGGIVGTRDLREYKPVWRAPIRISYREYDVYAPAPPSAAGVMIGETLNILRGYELSESAKTIHLLLEATRRAAIEPLELRAPVTGNTSADAPASSSNALVVSPRPR